MLVLTVIADFGNYKRGDRIEDQDLVKAIRASNNAVNVVPVLTPAPEKRQAKK